MYDLIVSGGKIVLEEEVVCTDIGVRDGKITAMGELSPNFAAEVVDAQGKYIFPGLVDCHVHLNDPGFTWREDFVTGTSAAAVGGVTTVIDMPLQNDPPLFNLNAFSEKLAALSSRAAVDYAFWGAALEYNINNLKELHKAGCVAYKIFLGPVSDDYQTLGEDTVAKVTEEVLKFNGLIGFHAEDYAVIKGEEAKLLNKNNLSWRDYLAARPVSAELTAVKYVIELVRKTRVRAHICHVSHPAAADLIGSAQKEGLPITAETCMHYLIFSEADLLTKGALFKCAPPLRCVESQKKLWDYVSNGVLSAICSDHSPCRADEKDISRHGILGAWGGVSGLQNTMQLFFEYAVNRRKCPLPLLTRALSANPAKIFGLYGQKGTVAIGFDADLVIFDPIMPWRITKESLCYKNKISAFIGLSGNGLPVRTILRGKTIFQHGEGVVQPYNGRLVMPNGISKGGCI